ncbi:MAG: hypothetical protein JSU74_13775, partial [Candidatus Zixiibacteriota bacterium]
MKVEEKLNCLFDVYDSIRTAELTDDSAMLRRYLAEGLADSCLFLQDLDNDLKNGEMPKELTDSKVN